MASFSQVLTVDVSTPVGGLLTTLSPQDITSGLTLTNNNLTVTSNDTASNGVRASRPATGKFYFEVTVDNGTDHMVIGLVNDIFDLAEEKGIGNDAVDPFVEMAVYSIGMLPTSRWAPGQIMCTNGRQAGSNLLTWGVTNNAPGSTVGVAVDLDDGAIWFTSTAMRADGYNWNYDFQGVTSEPGVSNGFDLTFVFPGPYFAALSTRDNGSQATFNFGASPFVFGVPAGFVSYDQASVDYQTPNPDIPVPIGVGLATVPTTTAGTVTWQAPAGGPYTYDLQVLAQPTGSTLDTWATLPGISATSQDIVLQDAPANEIFFVRGRTVSGTDVSPWTLPVRCQHQITDTSHTPPAPGFLFTYFFYPSQTSGTDLIFTKVPIPQDPTAGPDGTAQASFYEVAYYPNTPANVWNTVQLWGAVPTFHGMQFGTDLSGNAVFDDVSTFKITGLTPNQEYVLILALYQGQFFPGQFQKYLVSLPASGSYSGGFLKPLLSPALQGKTFAAGPSEAVVWGQHNYIMVPVAITDHFAIHYEQGVFDVDAIGSIIADLKNNFEVAYNQCVTWFGPLAFAPTLKTSINPIGDHINVFLTANQDFGGAHLACSNADILLSSHSETVKTNNNANAVPGNNDLMNTDFWGLVLMAELSEVFMPNLSSLPDCDQHAVGEALSMAVAYEMFPNGWDTNYTTGRLPAMWMNAYTDQNGSTQSASLTFNRLDFVNNNPAGETSAQFPAIGCAAIFFMYLRHQLNFTFAQIITAMGQLAAYATMRQLYNKLTNTTDDPFPTFLSLLNSHYPQNADATDHSNDVPAIFMNPWPLS